MKIKSSMLLGILLSATLLLGACAPAQPAAPEAQPIKFAVLRIIDSLPMVVAQQEGFFEKNGVQVELLPVSSAPERDQLFSAGQADGMVTEALAALYYNQDEPRVKIVRFARAATAETHLFSILAAKDSGIASVADLKGVPVGISDGTVIAYLTDRMLQKEGLAPADIQTISVPSLTDRMALLGKGELKAAVLPEPLTTLAVQQGASVVLDDSKYPELAHSVIVFSQKTLAENPRGVRAFLAAVEEAVAAVNADPARYQSVLTDQKIVPEVLAGKFSVPRFVTKSVPTEAQYLDMMNWALEKGLVKKSVAYADAVDPSYLP